MKIRVLLLLLFAACCYPLSAQQQISKQQQTLITEITNYLKTRNVSVKEGSSASQLYFMDDSINYALNIRADQKDLMLVELSTTYAMSINYDADVLTVVADRLNRKSGVKCFAEGHSLTFQSEWYLLDYTPFRYSYARIHQQILSMASQFGPLYSQYSGKGHASGNGITIGPPHAIVVKASDKVSEEKATAEKEKASAEKEASIRKDTVVIQQPPYEARGKRALDVSSITLMPNKTILELVSYSQEADMKYQWCSVQGDACLVIGDAKYKLQSADKIAISPSVTYYSSSGKLSFRLIFPALPANAKKVDFVNDSDKMWYLKGISLPGK